MSSSSPLDRSPERIHPHNTPSPNPSHPVKTTTSKQKRVADSAGESISKYQKVQAKTPDPIQKATPLKKQEETAESAAKKAKSLLEEFSQNPVFLLNLSEYDQLLFRYHKKTDTLYENYTENDHLTPEQATVKEQFENFAFEMTIKEFIFYRALNEINYNFPPNFSFHKDMAYCLDFLEYGIKEGKNNFVAVKENFLKLLDMYIIDNEDGADYTSSLKKVMDEIFHIKKLMIETFPTPINIYTQDTVDKNDQTQFKSLDPNKPKYIKKRNEPVKPEARRPSSGEVDITQPGKISTDLTHRATSAFKKVKGSNPDEDKDKL